MCDCQDCRETQTIEGSDGPRPHRLSLAEVACIFLLACVLWRLNLGHVGWVNVVAGRMVLQVVICQVSVWVAVLTERFEL